MSSSPARDTDLRRSLPSVDEVLRDPEVQDLERRFGRDQVLEAVREAIAGARSRTGQGDPAALGRALAELPSGIRVRLERAALPSLVPVINATGVVVHTNLGRAPLSPGAAERVARIARSYCNLEFDLATGQRGQREVHAEARLRSLLGAEATVVVNNNAAAVLLAVNSLAEGREVLVSRGELVEIGGSFRIPDVLRKGGARLVEVGTTNRTRVGDYRAALGPDTAMILKVHPSNFEIVGFTESPSLADLVALAREARLPLVEDQGSGFLGQGPPALGGEPSPGASLAAGVSLVTVSGDKLLGGPQAGLVAGRKDLIEALRRNPLYRALRVDKMTLAALDAVLTEHQAGRAALGVPVIEMLAAPVEVVRRRARALADALSAACPQARIALADGASAVGGGAAPGVEVATVLVAVSQANHSPDALAAALRAERPPVVARVTDDRLVLDLRTVPPDDEPSLRDALIRVLNRP
ncbi:MAG TPA: L-seryl-tRNA(Sec) selenium transferase [Vicinamibacteria bacterium]|nr:L-seryl-tRNA(Sec) selenium transferase [Vicinamibacteria bacterium]